MDRLTKWVDGRWVENHDDDTRKCSNGNRACMTKLAHYEDLEEQGRLVVFPCKVGDKAYVITKCENVHVDRDDDYFTGTGTMECPFEDSCDIEDCKDDHIRIFETTVTDFWLGSSNENYLEVFFENINDRYLAEKDFEKKVFLAESSAKAALERMEGQE